MASEKLLVCSVFCGSEYDKFWLDMQRTYITKTFGEFDHAVYLSHKADREMFNGCTIVGTSSQGDKWEHRDGLRTLVGHAQKHPCYSGYLVLDSDAFPITPDWKDILDFYLARFNKRYAAVVRPENLDVFPHPCVVYARRPEVLWLGYVNTLNLLGQHVTDIACSDGDFLPLLKTNRKTPHPLLALIYFDLFYHHGCGSRVYSSHATNIGYYDQVLERSCSSPDELFDGLQADPQGFIDSLF